MALHQYEQDDRSVRVYVRPRHYVAWHEIMNEPPIEDGIAVNVASAGEAESELNFIGIASIYREGFDLEMVKSFFARLEKSERTDF